MVVSAIGLGASGNLSVTSSATSAACCWVLSFWSPALSWQFAGATRNKTFGTKALSHFAIERDYSSRKIDETDGRVPPRPRYYLSNEAQQEQDLQYFTYGKSLRIL